MCRVLACLVGAPLPAAAVYQGDVLETLTGKCRLSAPSMVMPHPRPVATEEGALRSTEELLPERWQIDRPVLPELMKGGQPALLRGTVVDTWPARRWTWVRLRELYGDSVLDNVAESDDYLHLTPDTNSALHPILRYHLPARYRNVSAGEFFARMEAAQSRYAAEGYQSTPAGRQRWRGSGQRLVLLSKMPSEVVVELQPQEFLYSNHKEAERASQFVWVSTPGVRTHTHFDSDHNAFVQLLGKKRFVLWPPNQTVHMCPFPRLHPLWHKSRVDFENPDVELAPCANYSQAQAITAQVEPGDVLYVPPFWWHTVESVSPSVSLATLSVFNEMYFHMEGVYNMQHFFDKLFLYEAKLYALRLFLTLAVRQVPDVKPGYEHTFFEPLVSRYVGLGHLMQDVRNTSVACVADASRGTPTCRSCLSSINFDVTVVWNHFKELAEDVRYTLFQDYVEEVSAQTLGANAVVPFWSQCFHNQSFFFTKPGSTEHNVLWTEAKRHTDIDLADMEYLDDME